MWLCCCGGTALADSTDVQLVINGGYVGGSAAGGETFINDAGQIMISLWLVREVLGYDTDWQLNGTLHTIDDLSK